MSISTFRRVYGAFACLSFPLTDPDPPEIHLLIVAARKDFVTLNSCINSAINNSRNRVESLSVIVPSTDVELAHLSCYAADIQIPFDVIDEETLISSESRGALRKMFGERYGWVLQQLVTTAYVSLSSHKGVLVVDADTLISNDRLVLSSDGHQILTPTYECHMPYYIFLENIGLQVTRPIRSFVPHAMLMQPIYMREALTSIGCGSIECLVNLVLKNANSREASPLCIEFELYAQYLIRARPEKVSLAKWGNIEIRPTKFKKEYATSPKSHQKWGSISMHSYLK